MIFFFLYLSFSVDDSKYRKCSDSKFCERNRYVENQKWSINPSTIQNNQNCFEATINDDIYKTKLKLLITFLSSSVRVRIQPKETESFSRYDLSKEPTIINQTEIANYEPFTIEKTQEGEILIGTQDRKVTIINNPLKITLSDHDEAKIILNEDNAAVYETKRSKEKYPQLFEPVSFDYQTDKIPNGPTSVAMSVDFVSSGSRLSGLPSHALHLTLPQTYKTRDPIRLFNTETIKYRLDSVMSQTGSVPFIFAHSRVGFDGVFWANPSETWVDTSNSTFYNESHNAFQRARFISEGGFIDAFLLSGRSSTRIVDGFTRITGKPQLPPLFALGFHQSRWGYFSDEYLADVSTKLDALGVPHDSIWLDIDFLGKNRQYFTFDTERLPNAARTFNSLTRPNRYVIVPVGPSIRAGDSGYSVFSEGEKGRHFVRTPFNRTFFDNAYCGKAAWPDFTRRETRRWWGSLFEFARFNASFPRMFFWCHINAPTVFEDHELTFSRTLVLDGRFESREVHNAYGHLMVASTFAGVALRQANVRPFLLSSSFFAGTQRYAALTVAGAPGTWMSLRSSVQIVLQLGLAGQICSGIDVGGEHGKTNARLLSRWYQVGAWLYPFFRTHAHHLAAHREIYILRDNEDLFEAAKEAVVDRYLLLPYWYTTARNGNVTGEPIVRPLWWIIDHNDEKEFERFADVDDVAMLGDDLMVVPFLTENETDRTVSFPKGMRWFDYRSLKVVVESGSKNRQYVQKFNNGKTAVFVKGGAIIPRKLFKRRSSELMINDPLMLLIAVDSKNAASGKVYIDDGKSFGYVRNNEFIFKEFSFNGNKLISRNAEKIKPNRFSEQYVAKLDQIVITGLSKMPSKINDNNGNELHFSVKDNVVTISRINILIKNDFEINFEF